MSWVKLNTTLIVAVVPKLLRRLTGNQLCLDHTGSKPLHSENRIELGQCYWRDWSVSLSHSYSTIKGLTVQL